MIVELSETLALAEVALQDVVVDDVAQRPHDHGLVQRQVALGDLTGPDSDRIVEAAGAVSVKGARQFAQVLQALRGPVHHRQERRVGRHHTVAVLLRLRGVDEVVIGVLTVGEVPVGLQAQRVHAPLGVAPIWF